MMPEESPQKAFLGVGWEYPLYATTDGTIATAAYEEDVREAILIILGTNPGERVMRPDFGAGLRAFVFEPGNITTLHLIETRVREALIDWEPRIDTTEVSVRIAQALRNRIDIDIQYRIRATNSKQNLVYPFYLLE